MGLPVGERAVSRSSVLRSAMSRQYNMYNVQLSEFWKQRVGREHMHNAPYLFEEEGLYSDTVSEAPSQALSNRSHSTRLSKLSSVSAATQAKIDELEAKLKEERMKREEVEKQLM